MAKVTFYETIIKKVYIVKEQQGKIHHYQYKLVAPSSSIKKYKYKVKDTEITNKILVPSLTIDAGTVELTDAGDGTLVLNNSNISKDDVDSYEVGTDISSYYFTYSSGSLYEFSYKLDEWEVEKQQRRYWDEYARKYIEYEVTIWAKGYSYTMSNGSGSYSGQVAVFTWAIDDPYSPEDEPPDVHLYMYCNNVEYSLSAECFLCRCYLGYFYERNGILSSSTFGKGYGTNGIASNVTIKQEEIILTQKQYKLTQTITEEIVTQDE